MSNLVERKNSDARRPPSGTRLAVGPTSSPARSRVGVASRLDRDSPPKVLGTAVPKTVAGQQGTERKTTNKQFVKTSTGSVRRSSIDRLRVVFSEMDVDGDGSITKDEMEAALSASSSDEFKGAASGVANSFYKKFREKHPEKTTFSFRDLLRLMYPQKCARDWDAMDRETRPAPPPPPPETEDLVEEDVDDLFSIFDEAGLGELDRRDFGVMLRKLGVNSEEELDDYFNEIDADGGGTVSVDELKAWWFSTGSSNDKKQASTIL